MSAAHAYDAAPVLRAERGGLAPTALPVKMSLYDLMSRFWQLDAERPFTANETRLYFYWLNQFNLARWVGSLPRRPLQVCADLGLTDKTLVVARVGLVSRGLLSYTEGHRRLSAVWSLGGEPTDSPQESRNNSGLLIESAPKKAGNTPAYLGGETPVSPQESRNNSGDIYKEEEKTTTLKEKTPTVAAHAAGPAQKKIEVVEISSAHLPADEGQLVPPVARPPQPKPAKAKPAGEPEHFAAFWEAYPRHDDRQKAVAAFARLSPEDQAAAPARAAEWMARRTDWIDAAGKDWRPYPATWLNNKRWKDEPQPTPSPATAPSHATHSAFSKPGAARHHVPEVKSYGTL